MIDFFLHLSIATAFTLLSCLVIELGITFYVFGRPIPSKTLEGYLREFGNTYRRVSWNDDVLLSIKNNPSIIVFNGFMTRLFFSYVISNYGVVWRWSRASQMINQLFNDKLLEAA